MENNKIYTADENGGILLKSCFNRISDITEIMLSNLNIYNKSAGEVTFFNEDIA